MFLKTTTAALTVLALAGAAHAQSDNANANATAEGQGNYGQLVSGLQNGTEDVAAWAGEISTLATDAEVEIVTLSELKGDGAMNAEAFDNALAENSADLSSARMAIEGNEALVSALDAESYTADQVVMVDVESDSHVTLVVDDRS